MSRIGTLSNRLYRGTCFATETHIGLCFDKDEKRLCRLGTDPLGNFESLELSNYDHWLMGWMSATQSKNCINDSILFFHIFISCAYIFCTFIRCARIGIFNSNILENNKSAFLLIYFLNK